MIIYLAAPFQEKEEARRVREILVAAGHEVNSRWIDNHLSEYDELTPELLQEEAQVDLLDIDEADAVVLLNNFPCSAGRMFEWGYAYSNMMPIVVIGETTKSVFRHLPNVYVVRDEAEAARTLAQLAEDYGY